MPEGGEGQRWAWGAKGLLHCLRAWAGRLGHPRETKDDLKVALKSQKPTCHLRNPGFIS